MANVKENSKVAFNQQADTYDNDIKDNTRVPYILSCLKNFLNSLTIQL